MILDCIGKSGCFKIPIVRLGCYKLVEIDQVRLSLDAPDVIRFNQNILQLTTHTNFRKIGMCCEIN